MKSEITNQSKLKWVILFTILLVSVFANSIVAQTYLQLIGGNPSVLYQQNNKIGLKAQSIVTDPLFKIEITNTWGVATRFNG